MYYVLDEYGNPVKANAEAWINWELNGNRILKKTKIDNIEISTIFLGMDHSFSGGKPILWETMIFGGPKSEFQERYTSREEALKRHEEIVKQVEILFKIFRDIGD